MVMPTEELHIEVVRHIDLAPETLPEILALAQRAYDRDLSSYYYHFPAPTHVIAYQGDAIVSRALGYPVAPGKRWPATADRLRRTRRHGVVTPTPRLRDGDYAESC
jgi:hypothetical protein